MHNFSGFKYSINHNYFVYYDEIIHLYAILVGTIYQL